MRYIAAKTDVINPDITSPEWSKAQEGYININRWNKYDMAPKTIFKLLRGPEGISVYMHTAEKNLRAEHRKVNENICCDSCMEFFFKPDPRDTRYLNFEFNPKGILYLCIGENRYNRAEIDADREIFSIVSDAKDGDWSLKFYIPDSFLMNYFKHIGTVCKGNFYKCGDETCFPHYASWSEIEVKEPDFHLPDFFGRIQL